MPLKLNPKSLSEVYEILILLPREEYNKIPQEIIKGIRDKRDEEYEVDIEKIENGIMFPETVNILGTIYIKYLSTSDEKNVVEEIIDFEKNHNNSNILNNLKYENELFKRKENNDIEKENKIIPINKKSIIFRLIDKIKSFFRKVTYGK